MSIKEFIVRKVLRWPVSADAPKIEMPTIIGPETRKEIRQFSSSQEISVRGFAPGYLEFVKKEISKEVGSQLNKSGLITWDFEHDFRGDSDTVMVRYQISVAVPSEPTTTVIRPATKEEIDELGMREWNLGGQQ